MQFDKVVPSGSGSSHVPINFEDMSWFDGTPFKFKKILHPTVKEAANYETDKRKRLELVWYYWILFKGSELFQFHSYSQTCISEEETEPTNEQLKELIITSYKHLQRWFEERRTEYLIFQPIEDISPDTIEQTVHQLKEVLLPQLK